MKNPVLTSPEFTAAQPGTTAYQQTWQPPSAPTYQQTWQPPNASSAAGFAQSPPPPPDYAPPVQDAAWSQISAFDSEVMTVEDVLTKTSFTMAMLVGVATAAWLLIPFNVLLPTGLICGLGAIIFPLVAAFRRNITPVTALGYAAVEGVFIAALSKLFESYYPGIVQQAVIGTFAVAGVALVAFRYGGFRLSGRLRRIVWLAVIGFAAVMILNFVLSLFGVSLGLIAMPGQSVSTLAWVAVLIGIVLASLSLVDDFQFVEEGVAAGAPAARSWTAAFGLTVTLVWLYTNLLRLISYLRN